MSRTSIAIAALSLAACNLADAQIKGSGAARTEARTTDTFTSIEVRGAIALDVTVGAAQAIEVTADDNVLPIIRTTVKKGRLVIDSADSYSSTRGVTVTIVVPSLASLGASGSSTAQVKNLDGAALALAVSGAGSIVAQGRARGLTLAVSGSGTIGARNVAADDATVSVSGSGKVELSAADALTVQLSGSGTVDYWGKPSVTKAISGSAKIRRH